MRISDWSSDVCSSDLMMHAANRFPAQHRAGRMNLHPQRPRLANIAKRQLERVYAHAIGLMQGARRLLIAYITLMQLFAAEYVRVITENLFHDTPFVFKKRHFLGAMGRV